MKFLMSAVALILLTGCASHKHGVIVGTYQIPQGYQVEDPNRTVVEWLPSHSRSVIEGKFGEPGDTFEGVTP